ncbi:MAG: 50S ribosomal protein L10 [Mucinivorans sp.]
MKREEKLQLTSEIAGLLGEYPHYYLTDISGLNAEKTAALRRLCFEGQVKLHVVKNTFFAKALAQVGKENAEIDSVLVGSTAVMFTSVGNAPAKLIKDFRKKENLEKPLLKAAYVDDCVYLGEGQLASLVALKSHDELVADVIALLQSPAKNVISGLQAAAGGKIAGLVKTLENR